MILARIHDPPPQLYARGEIPEGHAIAVVGSRNCTPYGRRVAHRLATDIVRAGFVVVSGLARGVDAAAHRGALESAGKTVAVLPCGIDTVYPQQHTQLAARIAESGAVVTEFDPGDGVHKGRFHQRNRIIAGLAVATVVVEAERRSGAKITANFALQYDRELLAVPGPVDSPTSFGTNGLLVEGAAAVCTGIEALIEQLPAWARQEAHVGLGLARRQHAAAVDDLGHAARSVFDAIPHDGSCGVAQLAAATSLATGLLLATLTNMEVRGLIRSVGNQQYEKV